MSSYESLTIVDQRSCGDCTACCTHLPIPAGLVGPDAKPVGVACSHVCEAGCGIYSERPTMCEDFRCAWLADTGWPAAWRPNRVGLLALREMIGKNVPAAVLYEIRPGALEQSVAAEIAVELQRTAAFVVVVDSDKRRWDLPGHSIEHLSHRAPPAPHFLKSAKSIAKRREAG